MFRIGIDFGGTKIESILLNPNGEELFRKRIPTEREKGYDHILNNITRLYRETAAQIENAEHTVGIGIPGALSTRTGLVKNSNTTCTIGKPLKTDIESAINHSIEIENDANCFTLAEANFGAGKGKDMVFGMIIGTGCGGGIAIHGKLWPGLMAIAGEWGHSSINPNGHDCYCGNRGCVETYISGGGVQKRFASQFGETKTFHEICSAYEAGSTQVTEFMDDFFWAFGQGIANLITTLDPGIIVDRRGCFKFRPPLYAGHSRSGTAHIQRRARYTHREASTRRFRRGPRCGPAWQ